MLLSRHLKKFKASYNLEENQVAADFCKEMLTKYLELAIVWSEDEFGEEGFVQLKNNFIASIGLAPRDESFFERYGDYFLNYYLFVADLKQILANSKKYPTNSQATHNIIAERNIFSAFLASSRYTSLLRSDPGVKALHLLRSINFSLFRIVKTTKNYKHIVVKDVFLKTKILVEPLHDQLFNGLNKGELIQGFIFPVGRVSFLLKGHICHPSASKPYIEDSLSSFIIEKMIPPEAVLQQLAKSFQLFSRHLKIPIAEVYKTIKS